MKASRMVVVLSVLLSVAAQAQTEVERLTNKVLAANATDRWMPTGRVEFTMDVMEEIDGQENAYSMTGTLRYNATHGLFERYLTSGEPVRRKATPDGDEPHEQEEVVRELLLAVGPDSYTSYTSSTKQMITRRDGLVRLDNFGILTGGVLSQRLLMDAKHTKTLAGGVLTIKDAAGPVWKITADDQGQMTHLDWSWTKGGVTYSRQFDYSEYVALDGGPRSLPQTVTVTSRKPNAQWVQEFHYRFVPEWPSGEQLTIRPPEGTASYECTSDNQLVGLTTAGFGGPTAVKLYAPVTIHNHFVDPYGEPGWDLDCCNSWCDLGYVLRLHHHHCQYTTHDWETCTSYWHVYETQWPHCFAIPYETWCPEYRCYVDPAEWTDYASWIASME